MNFPIPKHLQSIMFPTGNGNSEFKVTGRIQCICSHDSFEVYESNERQRIKILCKKCRKEFVLLDSEKHGWNGFVCGDRFPGRNTPFAHHLCPKCKEDAFRISVRIYSQGKEDFKAECLSGDNSFTSDDWVNAFDWITISLFCEKCGASSKAWLDLETM